MNPRVERKPLITPAMRQVLEDMHQAEQKEAYEDAIVCDGIECWIGLRRISRRTVDGLLRLIAISPENFDKSSVYILNDTGKAILKRPELAAEIRLALHKGRPFTIENERVKNL